MYIFFLERYPHGIFAAGAALVPAQEKKKISDLPNDLKVRVLGIIIITKLTSAWTFCNFFKA